MKTIIEMPCLSFNRLKNPVIAGRENYTGYVAVVNIKDLPNQLNDWRDVNVRDSNEKSVVYGKIFESLVDDPDMFFFKNRGMTIIAKDTVFDNKNGVVAIEFDDPEVHGLLDGGHTFTAIRDYLSGYSVDDNAADAYIKIEIITNVSDIADIVGIVESRNTSTQVKDESIEELSGTFEEIHKLFDGTAYGDRIHYSEFELDGDGNPKDIDIKDILSALICFDIESFNDEKHPLIAYNGKKATLKHFSNRKEEMKKYIPLLPKILQLYDTIYKFLPDMYNITGNFGNLTGVTRIYADSRRDPIELKYIGETSSYVIPKGFIMPILAAMRNLVVVKNNKASRAIDPIKVFTKTGEGLSQRVVEVAREFQNPNKMGKYAPLWRGCYDAVQMYVFKNM